MNGNKKITSDMLELLKAPFNEVHHRVGQNGKIRQSGADSGWGFATMLAYVDARHVMDRLDMVVGPENWSDEYLVTDSNLYCRISIRIDDYWVAKTDVGTESNVEKEKGNASDAFKRAAVKWGIGRYLYGLPRIEIQYKEEGSFKK